MHWRSHTATILILSNLVLTLTACGSRTALDPSPEPEPVDASAIATAEPVAPTAPTAPTATAKPAPAETPAPKATPEAQQEYFQEAVNRAASAVSIGQTAQSPDDWKLAASRWQQALNLLQKVPATDPNYAKAQTKIKEYQQNLNATQRRVAGVTPSTTENVQSKPNGLVAEIPIIERRGGTPVVSVTMKGQNGSKTYPMLFDTGATGTLITAEMASDLGVVIVGETTATIADGSQVVLPIGYVDAIEIGGLKKEVILVAIGGDVGLLGQDVYGEYGISMGSHVINLYE